MEMQHREVYTPMEDWGLQKTQRYGDGEKKRETVNAHKVFDKMPIKQVFELKHSLVGSSVRNSNVSVEGNRFENTELEEKMDPAPLSNNCLGNSKNSNYSSSFDCSYHTDIYVEQEEFHFEREQNAYRLEENCANKEEVELYVRQVFDKMVTRENGSVGNAYNFTFDVNKSGEDNKKVIMKLHEEHLRLENELEASGTELSPPEAIRFVDDGEKVPKIMLNETGLSGEEGDLETAKDENEEATDEKEEKECKISELELVLGTPNALEEVASFSDSILNAVDFELRSKEITSLVTVGGNFVRNLKSNYEREIHGSLNSCPLLNTLHHLSFVTKGEQRDGVQVLELCSRSFMRDFYKDGGIIKELSKREGCQNPENLEKMHIKYVDCLDDGVVTKRGCEEPFENKIYKRQVTHGLGRVVKTMGKAKVPLMTIQQKCITGATKSLQEFVILPGNSLVNCKVETGSFIREMDLWKSNAQEEIEADSRRQLIQQFKNMFHLQSSVPLADLGLTLLDCKACKAIFEAWRDNIEPTHFIVSAVLHVISCLIVLEVPRSSQCLELKICASDNIIFESALIIMHGKGLTFDSDGYNFKTGFGGLIELMKFAMGETVVVFGKIKVLEQIEYVRVEVQFIVSFCDSGDVESVKNITAIYIEEFVWRSKAVKVSETNIEKVLIHMDDINYYKLVDANFVYKKGRVLVFISDGEIVGHCFALIQWGHLKLVMDSIPWAFGHTVKNIVGASLTFLLELLNKFQHLLCPVKCGLLTDSSWNATVQMLQHFRSIEGIHEEVVLNIGVEKLLDLELAGQYYGEACFPFGVVYC